MAPLGKVAGSTKHWVVDVTAYTLAGGVASVLVGALLGALGGWLMPGQGGRLGILVAIAVALLATARELGWIAVPLPQFQRQTNDVWAKLFPSTLTAALWGFDVGLVFTTWFTLAGVWLLVVVAILTGEPVFGAALFAVYWLGRALPVWLAPWLLEDANATPQLLDGIAEQQRLFERIHAVALVWAVGVLLALLTHGTLR